jgi:hypothetical protein
MPKFEETAYRWVTAIAATVAAIAATAALALQYLG